MQAMALLSLDVRRGGMALNPCNTLNGDSGGLGVPRCPTRSLPAHACQVFELSTEIVIKPAIDEWVVAGTAHGKPVEGEVESIACADDLARDKHYVAVEGEPADGKHCNHCHQHLDCLLLLLPVGEILLGRYITNGISPP